MEIRVLKYFLTIAREENITRAAEQLHITQPTLSRQMMQLEEELGVRLFQRNRVSVTLTEEGRLLRRRAQEILELAEKAEQEIILNRETVTGTIGIGCGETRNMEGLSRLMTSFRQHYPEVVFHIYTANADDVKEKLENGMLDFGLLLEPVEISRFNFVRMPLREQWCVLMRRDSPLAEKETITPADLVGVPLIVARRHSVRNELDNWFGEYYRRMHVVTTVNLSYNNCSIMVENHVGVGLVHDFGVPGNALCLRPLSPEIGNSCVLVWRKEQVFPPAVTKFIEHVRAAAPML